jgi:hypothetical protein
MSASSTEEILPGDSGLARLLSREIQGEVLFDRASRGRYSTDASIYQVEPLGVIVPRTIDDVAAALAIARDAGDAGAAQGRGDQPVRPDGEPGAGDGLLEVSAPGAARRYRRPGR